MPRRVLMVCLGNICRSPMAEGALRCRLPDGCGVDVDSAGTAAWHVGKPPDPRAVAEAARHEVDISGQRARRVSTQDFRDFDLICAMDRSNLADLEAMRPADGRAEIRLLCEDTDVPDPWHDGRFAEAFAQIDAACAALIPALTARSA